MRGIIAEMGLPRHPAVSRVVAAAQTAGLTIHVRRFPEGTRTAQDAARAVGCEVAQIVKSLVFVADGRPVLALVSGADRVDPARLASALAATDVRRATGDEARSASGFAIGGVPPFGHERRLDVILDPALLRQDTVWAAAGLPDAVFEVTPQLLQRIAGAVVAEIAEDRAIGLPKADPSER
jgi:prolyl-tRNA editing enzyme YbaK/EbsC (Cys-tRNA(Pro) deacylase)